MLIVVVFFMGVDSFMFWLTSLLSVDHLAKGGVHTVAACYVSTRLFNSQQTSPRSPSSKTHHTINNARHQLRNSSQSFHYK